MHVYIVVQVYCFLKSRKNENKEGEGGGGERVYLGFINAYVYIRFCAKFENSYAHFIFLYNSLVFVSEGFCFRFITLR